MTIAVKQLQMLP